MNYIIQYDADSRYSDKDNVIFFFMDIEARYSEDVIQGLVNRNKKIIIALDKIIKNDDTSYYDYYLEHYPDADIEFMLSWDVFRRYGTYFKDHCKKYFFGGPVTTMSGLNDVLQSGSSRVILGGDLFFDIENISKRLLESVEIGIQSWENRYLNKVTDAIVFPQELSRYEEKCNVTFLMAPWDFPYVKYEIYNGGFWSGAISDIIPYSNNMDMVPLLLMNPYYTDIRMKCRHMCFNCNRCNESLDLARAANAIRLGEENEDAKENISE